MWQLRYDDTYNSPNINGSASHYWLKVYVHQPNKYAIQTAIDVGSGNIYTRALIDGKWNKWKRVIQEEI